MEAFLILTLFKIISGRALKQIFILFVVLSCRFNIQDLRNKSAIFYYGYSFNNFKNPLSSERAPKIPALRQYIEGKNA
jgi:hypothetical protein